LQQIAGTTPVNAVPADDSITKSMLAFNPVEGVIGKNLFNLLDITVDRYVDYTTGNLEVAAGFNAAKIPVIAGRNISVSGTTNQQYCWKDSSDTYISGEVMWIDGTMKQSPANAAFLSITVDSEHLTSLQIEYGDAPTAYEPFKYVVTAANVANDSLTRLKLNNDVFEKTETIVTVKKDGSGDFLNIPAALASITDNCAKKPYRLLIGEGDFTEINWFMKPYVRLEGKSPEKTRLTGVLPETASDDDVRHSQVFWWNVTGCEIKNLSVTAKNMMYPIHADGGAYGNKDGNLAIDNCEILHFGNQQVKDYRIANALDYSNLFMSTAPLGLGTSDGMEVHIRNTKLNEYFYVHNNGDFERGCLVRLNNCTMVGAEIQSMGSRTEDVVEFNGCTITGDIHYMNPSWLSAIPNDATTNLAEFKVCGSGNIVTGIFVNEIWRTGTGQDYIPEFTGINQLGW